MTFLSNPAAAVQRISQLKATVPLIEPMHEQPQRAIGLLGDRACPLCHVQLITHDGRACCSCCGTTHLESSDRLEMNECPVHRQRDGEHWEEIWALHDSPPGAA